MRPLGVSQQFLGLAGRVAACCDGGSPKAVLGNGDFRLDGEHSVRESFPHQLDESAIRCPRIDSFDWWRYSQGVNVHLTPELEDLVQSKVKSGRYNSASELVSEALRLLQRREEIRERIEEGWQSVRRGELVDGEEVFDRIDGELEAMERSAGK